MRRVVARMIGESIVVLLTALYLLRNGSPLQSHESNHSLYPILFPLILSLVNTLLTTNCAADKYYNDKVSIFTEGCSFKVSALEATFIKPNLVDKKIFLSFQNCFFSALGSDFFLLTNQY